jgi:hypothetical protein
VPNYTLRVQLVGNPDESVYNDLHTRMQKGGFLRSVDGTNADGDQASFMLPHGTYYGSSEANVSRVRDWANEHANAAWGKNIVFVAQTDTWAWGKS